MASKPDPFAPKPGKSPAAPMPKKGGGKRGC